MVADCGVYSFHGVDSCIVMGAFLGRRQVEIEDMEWNEVLQAFTYECPCGDLFQITLEELQAGELGAERLF